MRPVRLLLDGFGSYRKPAEADFSDVDFFALVGPTGSGKSTVIDGLCFALYGTVPRWGRENVIAQALAPAANACRVALVFEAAGKRYAAVRALVRNARGQVNTKEARLEILDSAVPASASMTELLEASVEAIAEGPDQVKAAVQGILGLTYEHFTQSVLLPQGRFSEFLHSRPADRQNLLVELLAFGVYETVGQKARERAKLAGDQAARAKDAIADLPDATPEAEAAAQARIAELAELATEVTQLVGTTREQADQAKELGVLGHSVRAEVDLLAKVSVPDGVPDLARQVTAADKLTEQRRAERDRCDEAEQEAAQVRDALPEAGALQRQRDAYGQQRELAAVRDGQDKALAQRRAEQDACAKALAVAASEHEQAQAAYAAAERTHAAIAVAQRLRVGEDCPVCLQPVAALPHHSVPADLADGQSAVTSAASAVKKAQAERDRAAEATVKATAQLESTAIQLEKVAAALADASGEAEVRGLLETIAVADERLGRARGRARAARTAATEAERQRAGLDEVERRAWTTLRTVRDSVVALGAPAVAEQDLVAAWGALTAWSKEQHGQRSTRLDEVRQTYRAATERVNQLEQQTRERLGRHEVEAPGAGQAESAVATQQERARHRLDQVRASQRKAAELAGQLKAFTEDEQVASMLGRHLRASSFERWLCGEALDSLVIEASQTLMELSGGQYQLDRDERNDLFVIDYQDAGARRPVHTLSGGETFQASLALALALSRQVVGLSAGMRDLNSMFLDEGFGTLDEDTLEVVGSTLERLSSDSEQMIGIITHVPALAERAPVRFVVSRAGMTSTLRKEGVT